MLTDLYIIKSFLIELKQFLQEAKPNFSSHYEADFNDKIGACDQLIVELEKVNKSLNSQFKALSEIASTKRKWRRLFWRFVIWLSKPVNKYHSKKIVDLFDRVIALVDLSQSMQVDLPIRIPLQMHLQVAKESYPGVFLKINAIDYKNKVQLKALIGDITESSFSEEDL